MEKRAEIVGKIGAFMTMKALSCFVFAQVGMSKWVYTLYGR